MMYVALFCIAAFHGTERYDKPFNPVIGETFEHINPDTGVRFLAEQVSHKPALSVCSLENDKFQLRQTGVLNVRFMGNSLDVDSTSCKCYVTLKKTNETFTWRTPRATVHNAIVGKVWVDHHGNMPLKNQATGDKCDIKWKKCGWFGANRYEVEGDVVDAQGNVKISIFGKWNGSLSAKWHFDGLYPKGTTTTMWTKDPTSIPPYNQTPYAKELNKMTPDYEKLLPPTDSRLRPDRRYLEKRDSQKASVSKLQVEEKQRSQENLRKTKNETWVPRWFYPLPDQYFEGTTWVSNEEYWKEREEKARLIQEDPSSEAAIKLLVREDYVGQACDFRSYPQEF
eukprot:TRINITY_DN4028_c0_g1_i2.p1 TRINITY_DN4028_c0_g1~~TRINITY_DN4028_c0_g1_i2.p1  ORF type:complete len:339 (-),score=35.29 TRINITY_DN4028_c0_g1_i2:90-1106(-)